MVDRGMRCCANIEFGKLVILYVDLVLGTSFALRLDFLRLSLGVSRASKGQAYLTLTCSTSLGEPPFAMMRLEKLRADDRFLFANANFMAADSAS